MKIGVVFPYYKPAIVYGGPVRSVSALCEGLIQAGAQVTVLTTDANGVDLLTVPTRQPVDVDGVPVYYYPRLGSRLAASYYYSPGFKRACQEKIRNFEVVYICGTWTYAMLAGATAALAAGVPFVVSPRRVAFLNRPSCNLPFSKGKGGAPGEWWYKENFLNFRGLPCLTVNPEIRLPPEKPRIF